jgi:predicted amidophosphoribosyltransferase
MNGSEIPGMIGFPRRLINIRMRILTGGLMPFFSRCPACKKLHVVEPEACGCGHAFSEKAKGADAEWAHCGKCGLPVRISWKECPECHSTLGKNLAFRCPKCKKEVAPDQKFCGCGFELVTATGECPYCRRRIRADSAVCPKCGKGLREAEGGERGGSWVCGTCGGRLEYYGAHCPACGS